MDFSTDIMTILRRGGDPWSKMAPTGADAACAQAPACQTYLPIDEHTEILVNPSGQFVEGGPRVDTGLTGRKLMVDTYGGLGSHGGGAFSGKDPSKVDRSAAYMARLIAHTIVDAGLAAECEVGISYAIGKADPVAFEVDTLGTGEYSDRILTAAARDVFVLRPAGIIDVLNLRTPRYRDLAVYGRVGRDWPRWEQTWRFERDLRKAWSPMSSPGFCGGLFRPLPFVLLCVGFLLVVV